MALVNMQRTPAEAKEYASPALAAGDAPKYPYGLCLCLDSDTLSKLGITYLPEVGTKFVIVAEAIVQSVGMNQQVDGDKEQRAELQITDMSLNTPKNADPAAMYPQSKMNP